MRHVSAVQLAKMGLDISRAHARAAGPTVGALAPLVALMAQVIGHFGLQQLLHHSPLESRKDAVRAEEVAFVLAPCHEL